MIINQTVATSHHFCGKRSYCLMDRDQRTFQELCIGFAICSVLVLVISFAGRYYNDVIMDAMTSQITNRTIVYLTVYSGTDERKHQSSGSLAFVWGIHWWPVNSPNKWPGTRKMFPFDDVTHAGAVLLVVNKSIHIWAACVILCEIWIRGVRCMV